MPDNILDRRLMPSSKNVFNIPFSLRFFLSPIVALARPLFKPTLFSLAPHPAFSAPLLYPSRPPTKPNFFVFLFAKSSLFLSFTVPFSCRFFSCTVSDSISVGYTCKPCPHVFATLTSSIRLVTAVPRPLRYASERVLCPTALNVPIPSVMSSCRVFGFFHIDCVSHLEFARTVPLETPSSPCSVRSVSLFPVYKSGISNLASPITGATIRSPSSFPGQIHQRGAFVFLDGALCVRPVGEDCLIDASVMLDFPNVPSLDGLPTCRTFGPFPPSYISASGFVSGAQFRLSDRKTVLSVQVSQYVRESLETFHVASVFSPSPRAPVLTLPSTAAC